LSKISPKFRSFSGGNAGDLARHRRPQTNL